MSSYSLAKEKGETIKSAFCSCSLDSTRVCSHSSKELSFNPFVYANWNQMVRPGIPSFRKCQDDLEHSVIGSYSSNHGSSSFYTFATVQYECLSR